MLCLKNHRQWIYSLLFFLSVAFISLLGFVSDSSAVSDLTYTIDSSNYSNSVVICQNGSSTVPLCSSFNYLFVEFNYTPSVTTNYNFAQISYTFNSSNSYSYISSSSALYSSSVLYSISSSFRLFKYMGISDSNASNLPSGWSIDITFSENNPYSSGPTGNLDIFQNGTYDVTNYATATVNVENEVIQGDYHDDLVSINNSILIVAAVGLVIYFFYAIYRMLLGGRK